ncbi:MAG: carbon-nitrogen hydrolase family protein, partial [Candidatus Xenobia bacterium]
MLAAVCETPPLLDPGTPAWEALLEAVRALRPELLLLPEMPFGPWLAESEQYDAARFEASCAWHEAPPLHELGVPRILGSRPRGDRTNEAFIWENGSYLPVHTKQYFPEEPGYWEARWFDRGKTDFRVEQGIGFLICTELMFNEHARAYGRAGAAIIAVPRAVGRESLRRWKAAARMAAIVSGCWVLSSNRGAPGFGGTGWIIDPHGDVVAQTTPATPVVAVNLNL